MFEFTITTTTKTDLYHHYNFNDFFFIINRTILLRFSEKRHPYRLVI